MHLSSQPARPTRCASGRRRPALAVLGGIRAPRPPGGERLLRSCSIQHFCTSPADPATPPPPNWRNPDRLREVGGGGCVPGHCPAPQVCFGHSCQVRTRRRGPVWGQPPAPRQVENIPSSYFSLLSILSMVPKTQFADPGCHLLESRGYFDFPWLNK